MAIEFPNTTLQYLVRDSNILDYNSPYTIMGWFYLLNDRDDWNALIEIAENSTESWEQDASFLNETGTTLRLWCGVGAGGTGVNGSEMPLRTWVHLAQVRESNTSCKLYKNGVVDVTNTHDISGRASAIKEVIAGRWSNGEWSSTYIFNGRVARIKAWTKSMIRSEIEREMKSTHPVETSRLHGNWPTNPGNTERTKDYSVNGNHWTEAGTLIDAPNPRVFPTKTPAKIYPGAFVEQEQVANAAIILPRHRSSKPPTGAFELNEKSKQAKGLAGWWPTLPGSQDKIARDLSRFSRHGFIRDNVTKIADHRMGQAYEYGGTLEYIEIPDATVFSPSNNNLTVSAWVRITQTTTTGWIIAKGTSGNYEWGMAMMGTGGTGYLEVSTWTLGGAYRLGAAANPPVVVSGDLVHWVFTLDDSAPSLSIYQNGKFVAVDTSADASPAGDGTSPVRIGIRPDGNAQFQGIIGDVRIYKGILPASEILNLYRNPWELYKPLNKIFPAVQYDKPIIEYGESIILPPHRSSKPPTGSFK